MKKLTKEQILALHRELIKAHGGSGGIRDEGLLDSALAAPFQTFDGKSMLPTVQQKAIRLGFGLIKNGVIRYTTDGSDPTSESAQYTEEIMIEDRTGDDNLLSAIVTSGSGGGFGGGGGGMRDDGGMRGQPPRDNGQPPQMPADDAGNHRS